MKHSGTYISTRGTVAHGSKRTSMATKTPSDEELAARRSSLRKSLESGLCDDDESEGPVKARFMPFFRKFWPHLERRPSHHSDTAEEVHHEIHDDATESMHSSTIRNHFYGKPVEEVDPFIFDDVSTIDFDLCLCL